MKQLLLALSQGLSIIRLWIDPENVKFRKIDDIERRMRALRKRRDQLLTKEVGGELSYRDAIEFNDVITNIIWLRKQRDNIRNGRQ